MQLRPRCLQMGPMSRDERIMAAVMVGAVILWVFGDGLGVASVTAAMLGLATLLLSGVLSWRDCLQYSQVRPCAPAGALPPQLILPRVCAGRLVRSSQP